MRLTLRVLLAYLDNILEPADAQAVEAKIAESETVSTLVHHIREISKRVRIPAPEVLGKGLGLDPNTVAEYLDYGLSDDAVRDFENVCMSSDVHMAEVAACHEILSLVLVKPAEIDPASRQRMYNLLNEPMPAPMTAEPVAVPVAIPVPSAAQRAAAAPTSAPVEPRRKAEVPSYLLQGEDRSGRLGGRLALAAAILLALTLIGGAAALKFVPHDDLPGFMQPMAVALFGNRSLLAEVEPEDHRLIHATHNASPTATPSGTQVVPLPLASASPTGLSTLGLRQPESAIIPAAGPAPTTTVVAPLPPIPTPGAVASGTMPAPAATAITINTTVATPLGTAGTTTTIPVPKGTGTAMPATGTTVAVPSVGIVTTTTLPAATGTPPATSVSQPAKIEAVGRVSSDVSQVILRFDPRAGWVRLQGRDALMVGDRLLSLPAFRPQISLAGGLMIDLLGGTAIELLPLDPNGVPGVRLLHGRLMMFTSGAPQAKVVLEDGNRRLNLALSAAELALEHQFHRPRGIDPAAGPLPWSLTLHVKSGEAAIVDPAGAGSTLKSPGSWLITGASPLEPLAAANLPLWISSDERDLLEKQAADFVEQALREDKAVNVALEEIVDDRRIENQQLALRCLTQLGDFNDFTPLLRDPTQRWSTWEKDLELLSLALDYGPYHAERIRDAFIKQHGPTKGADLYRLLWGFNDEQLKQGTAKALVETLDHDDLDFRVLAYWNLLRITGFAALSYAPQDPPLKRKTSIVKWQQKLDAGQIVHKKS
ncbi:MAG: hypothetical protein K8U03_01560 [Planctomycetia bacterium]|nr:hypothetical protein [Planctomycetia bacterium]